MVTNGKLNTQAIKIESKEPDIVNIVIKPALNTKLTEIENKIPDITNLGTKADLNTKEHTTEIKYKISYASKFINNHEFNWLTKISFNAKIVNASKTLQQKSN